MLKFKDLLAKPEIGYGPVLHSIKLAQSGIENPDDTQMEADFSQLAYMFVEDRAPQLIKYMLGFEVVERSDDRSRAVGIFGFKVGDDYYYVPAFFMNNQIKGVDLLFNKSNNTFMPLQETQVNHILRLDKLELGSKPGSNRAKLRSDFERPDFDFLSGFPGSPKTAEYSFRSAWDTMRISIDKSLEKDAEFQKAWGGLVCSLGKRKLPFEKTGENSALRDWLYSHGGPKATAALASALSNVKFANAALTFYPSIDEFLVSEYPTWFYPTKQADVSLIDDNTNLTEDQKRQFIKLGFAIEDKRAEDTKTQTYNIDGAATIFTPTEYGRYNIVLSGGNLKECFVFTSVIGQAYDEYSDKVREYIKPGLLLVETNKPNRATDINPEAGDVVYAISGGPDQVEHSNNKTGKGSAYDLAVDINDIKIGKRYIIIDKYGNTTPVVKISRITKLDDRHPVISIHKLMYPSISSIRISSGLGSIEQTKDNTVTVPKDARALEVLYGYYSKEELEELNGKTTKTKDTGYTDGPVPVTFDDNEEQHFKLMLGSLADVDYALIKEGYHLLDVGSDGIEYSTRLDGGKLTSSLNLKSAASKLIVDLGLKYDDAISMLKEAKSNFRSRRFIKFAQFVDVGMPQPQEQAAGIDPYTGVPLYNMPYEQEMQGSLMGVPARPDPDDPSIMEEDAPLDAEVIDLVQQAAELGQKTVFDHASIGGLSRVYDVSAVIDSYIPELSKSLDRLGRLIFLYYWRSEDFAERYGADDMADIEDRLRSVFKSYGDLVLSLKKKGIQDDNIGN